MAMGGAMHQRVTPAGANDGRDAGCGGDRQWRRLWRGRAVVAAEGTAGVGNGGLGGSWGVKRGRQRWWGWGGVIVVAGQPMAVE